MRQYLLPLFSGSFMLASAVMAEGKVASEQLNPADIAWKPNTPVKEVIVIIKTHFDIGYTHRVKEIVHHYRTEMIDQGHEHHGPVEEPAARAAVRLDRPRLGHVEGA